MNHNQEKYINLFLICIKRINGFVLCKGLEVHIPMVHQKKSCESKKRLRKYDANVFT